MRKAIFILTILTLCTCKNKEEEIMRISDEFKLAFLNEILSDTTELKIVMSKKELISNSGSRYMIPPTFPVDLKNPDKTINHNEFIANNLNITDTVFVKQQRMDNAKLDLNKLADFGFNIFDLKGLVEKKVPYNSILKMVDSLNLGTENYSFLKFSTPIFNKEKNLAYVILAQGSGGKTLILEKIDGKWKRKHTINEWIE